MSRPYIDARDENNDLIWREMNDEEYANYQALLTGVAALETAPATADDHASVSAQIITAKLAAIPVAKNEIGGIMQTLLGQTASAIPFFEQYALDPSMTAQQWIDFQALDQTTKDRLLYDVVRSIAAIMRYLSGDLPVGS